MWGNAEGTIYGTGREIHQQLEDADRWRTKEVERLLIVSRYILLLRENGHPFTHVCGISVEEIERWIVAYADGKNMGVDEIRTKYPWS